MKKYKKPILIVSDSTSEGIYAASGSNDVGAHIEKKETKPANIMKYKVCVWFSVREDNYNSTKIPHIKAKFDRIIEDVEIHNFENIVTVSGKGTDTITFTFSDRSVIGGEDFNFSAIAADKNSGAPVLLEQDIY